MKKRLSDIRGAYLCAPVVEVAHLWGKHPNSVRRAIDDGRLIGRRAYNGQWLVYVPSVWHLWGEPKAEFDSPL